ncbi:glycerophosphodiester phosphodiesterase [Nocardiopsis algeriensis]|uniref:Glycerophosphoryl diester phosphodiesterase n=1 Tax=Nocardiopsis algeriensis TaxID=1478215 RepID=A0A841IW84_9ACTN|nr:glycerophosphodiester phosphodiesterase [Nocardiopsis algeriensis]MBB6121536.1 glycerophosphoryl diester phosphodiesterase [Nocardiopsis algeriensis]
MTLSIALRGDTARFPGNTLPALRAAWRAGADLVKVDVHLTRDGYPVLAGERTAELRNRPPRPLADLSLAELAAARDDVEHRIPTLLEVLSEFRDGDVPALVLDSASAEAALASDALLRERGFAEHVLHTGSVEALGSLSAQNPSARLLLPWDQEVLPSAAALHGLRPTYLGMRSPLLTREGIVEAHRSGYLVAAWDVEDFSEMARLVGTGVDAIAAERLDDLVAVVSGRAQDEVQVSGV